MSPNPQHTKPADRPALRALLEWFVRHCEEKIEAAKIAAKARWLN